MIKKLAVLLFTGLSLFAQAQQTGADEVQMADAFRANGKIYVVIAVIALVFLALACFLVYIERKLKRIEDQVNNKINNSIK